MRYIVTAYSVTLAHRELDFLFLLNHQLTFYLFAILLAGLLLSVSFQFSNVIIGHLAVSREKTSTKNKLLCNFLRLISLVLFQTASDGLKHRVFEVCLADLQNDEDQHYRKIRLRAEDIQGKNVLTNFWVMKSS